MRSITRLLYVLLTLFGFEALVGCGKQSPTANNSPIKVKVIEVAKTKGTVLDDDLLSNKGRFVLDAYVDEDYHDYNRDPEGTNPSYNYDAGQYVTGNNVDNVYKMGTEWQLRVVGQPVKWVADVNTRFFCHWPSAADLTAASMAVGSNALDPGANTLSFDYNLAGSLPGGSSLLNGTDLSNAGYADANKMDDVVFAYTKQRFDRTNDVVNLTFYHALSQVRFCVDIADGTFDRTLKIRQIAIRNVKSGGSCTFRGEEAAPENKFLWDSSLAGATSFCQTYDANFSSSVPSGWQRGSTDSENARYNMLTCTNVFFVVPQTLNSASVSIVFEDSGTLYERSFDLDGDTFLPGKYYTYKVKASVLGRDISASISLEEWNNYDDKLFI